MIRHYKLSLKGHSTFDFWATVWSHGWCELKPFSVDPEAKTLQRVLELPNRKLTKLVMKGTGNKVEVSIETDTKLFNKDLMYVERKVRYMLSMDLDLSQLYRCVKTKKEFSWIAKHKAGRLLKSPTVFEDLVKTICTTNCKWEQTKRMVQRLCELLGKKTWEGDSSFPRPSRIANSSIEFLRLAGLGYRANYIHDIAIKVAENKIKLERWVNPKLPLDEIRKMIESIKGIGAYGSANMLRLLGRTDNLYIEPWMIKTFSAKRNADKPATKADIERYYSVFGQWKGLILWLDMITNQV